MFDDRCLERLKFIGACREADLGLPEITEFVHALDNGDEQQCRTAKRQIQDAIAGHQYRLAVRLYYLHALKTLSDRKQIDWNGSPQLGSCA